MHDCLIAWLQGGRLGFNNQGRGNLAAAFYLDKKYEIVLTSDTETLG
jgi:hypothetical protein